jgi:hypothetical protein
MKPPDEVDIEDFVDREMDSYEFDRIAALVRRTARMLKEHIGNAVLIDPLGGNATGEDLAGELNEAAAWLEQA